LDSGHYEPDAALAILNHLQNELAENAAERQAIWEEIDKIER